MVEKLKLVIRKLVVSDLFRISSYSIVSTLVKMILSLTVVKIAALYIGRAHFSTIFQIINVITIFSVFSIAALDTGIVRLVAESANNPQKLYRLKNVIISVVMIFSFTATAILLFFSKQLSWFFFRSAEFIPFFKLIAVIIFSYAFNKSYLAYLNGLKRFNLYYKLDISNNVLSIAFFSFFTIFFGLKGSIISYLLTPLLISFIIIVINRRNIVKSGLNFLNWSFHTTYENTLFKWKNILSEDNADKRVLLKTLFSFSILALISSLLGPYIETLIRQTLISKFSSNFSALWDALNKFSGLFIVFTGALINTYLIPHFAQMRNKKIIFKEMLKIGWFIFPPFIVISVLVYIFRNPIIVLLFSKDFQALHELIGLQLIGTLVSIFNILLQTLLIAKVNPLLLIPYNILLAVSNYFLNIQLSSMYGNIGLPISYILNSTLSCIFLVMLLRFTIFKREIVHI